MYHPRNFQQRQQIHRKLVKLILLLQYLIKILWLSLDPYMRGRMSKAKSYAASLNEGDVIIGGAVGKVIKSEHLKLIEKSTNKYSTQVVKKNELRI